MHRVLVPGLLVVATAACGVSTTRHRAVKNQLEACNAARTQLAARLDAEKKRSATLEDRNQRLTQSLEDAEITAKLADRELASALADRDRLAASRAELEAALAAARARKAEADRRLAEHRDLLSRFKLLIDAGKLEVKRVDGRMVLALPTDVLFPSGSAELSEEGHKAIVEVAAVLATIEGRRFQVEGHTDDVPIRSRRYPSNWELAAARAITVAKAMTEAGVPGGSLSAASFGEFRPTTSNATAEGREANRRIEIVLVPDLSRLPAAGELGES